ncbi:MAG: polyprenyl synthetase family protein [Thermomicrobiales bacterium]|nr:polyprenyl synthetase family protein [Thermomicrobiales bacterium]
MVELRTRDVFTAMQPDLLRVAQRVEDVARVDYPFVSHLVLDLVRAGGKRLRPLVLLLAARAYEPDPEGLITAAAGVELLHTASLVHDDTVDRAALRRGKPTLNAVLSSGAVILLGDYLFAQSAILAAATNNPRVVGIFASALGDMCDGQLREMFYAHQLDQSRDDYEKRIYGKTAALFAGSAEMGALIGNAPEPHVRALRAYGSDIGMAFQIVDDVLDLREGEEQTGKPAGQDLRQGTVTLPTMLYAAQLAAESPEARRLEAIIGGDNDDEADITALIADVRTSGALDTALDVATGYAERAKVNAAIVPDPETRGMLEQLADLAWNRQT